MIFIADLIAWSTCFGYRYAHHQELESIIQVVAACRIWCFGFQVVGMVWSWAPHHTDCNTNHLLHLVGILFPHINDDARSKPHQIYSDVTRHKTYCISGTKTKFLKLFKLFNSFFLWVVQNRKLQAVRQIQLWKAFGSCEKRLLPSSLPSVQRSVRTYRHGSHSTNSHEICRWGLSRKQVEIIQFWLK